MAGDSKGDETEYKCPLCSKDASNNVVQCDECQLWYHFECVNVDGSVENQDWLCPVCTTEMAKEQITGQSNITDDTNSTVVKNPDHQKMPRKFGSGKTIGVNGSKSGKPSRTSSAKARAALSEKVAHEKLQLQLRFEEEERADRDKRKLEQDKLDKEARERKMAYLNDFLNHKLKIRQEMLEFEDSDSSFGDDEEDHEGKAQSVSSWVINQVKEATNNQTKLEIFASRRVNTQPFSTPNPQHSMQPDNVHPKFVPSQPIKSNVVVSENANFINKQFRQLDDEKNLHVKMSQAQTIAEPISSAVNDGPQRNSLDVFLGNPPQNWTFSPTTKEQRDARKSMNTKLPDFSGRPEDWTFFYSSFEISTAVCGFSNIENLVRLRKCLKGEAYETVKFRLNLPDCVPEIMNKLRSTYGRPELIIQIQINGIRKLPPVKEENVDSVIKFSNSIRDLCATMEATGNGAYLCDPTLLSELTQKLPIGLYYMWAEYRETVSVVTLSTLSQWLVRKSSALENIRVPCKAEQQKRDIKGKGYVNSHFEIPVDASKETKPEKKRNCRVCKKEECQSVVECKQFRLMSIPQKWDVINSNKLCRTCLRYHGKFPCKASKICGVNGCTFRHHSLLHKNDERKAKEDKEPVKAQISTHMQDDSTVLFRIVPVKLFGDGTEVLSYAFLDEGSSMTLMEESLVNELGLSGVPEPICLKWTSNTSRLEESSQRVSMFIAGVNKEKKYSIKSAHTVKQLNLPVQSLSMESYCERYPYLKGIPIDSYMDAKPRILIGLDNWHVGAQLRLREGAVGQPFAAKSRLGWSVFGTCGESSGNTSVYHHNAVHICNCERDEELHNLVKKYSSKESLGVMDPKETVLSVVAARVQSSLDETTLRKRERFQLDWHDELNGGLFEKWIMWVKTLPQIDTIRFPRFFDLSASRTGIEAQLHMFVDASEKAGIGYLRDEHGGRVRLSLVAANTKRFNWTKRKGPISRDGHVDAGIYLCRQAQTDCYADEVATFEINDVSVNSYVNVSATHISPNSSYTSSSRDFFNKTFKISTINTFYVRDLGAFKLDSFSSDYSTVYYKINYWYKAWLPNEVDEGHNTKTTYQVEIRGADVIPGPVKITRPYFDCGQSNKWLVAVVLPIADIYTRHTQLRPIRYPKNTEISVLGMNFDRIDINQCPKGQGNNGPNHYAGTDRCKQGTTVREPLHGWGFKRGGYQCRCRPGYRLQSVVRRLYLDEIVERATDEQYFNGFDCAKIGWIQKTPFDRDKVPTCLRNKYIDSRSEYRNYSTGSLHDEHLNIDKVLLNYHPQNLMLNGDVAHGAREQFDKYEKWWYKLSQVFMRGPPSKLQSWMSAQWKLVDRRGSIYRRGVLATLPPCSAEHQNY